MTDEHKTKEIPAADPTAVELRRLSLVVERLVGSVDLLSHAVDVVHARLGSLETWRATAEDRFRRNSERAKGLDDRTSQNDLSHEAALATELVERQALAKRLADIETKTDAQTVILKRIAGILDTPEAKRVGQALAAFIIAALALATGWLAHGGRP